MCCSVLYGNWYAVHEIGLGRQYVKHQMKMSTVKLVLHPRDPGLISVYISHRGLQML